MPDKKLTLDEAMALLDKHAAAEAATAAGTKVSKKKEKVKDLLKAGAKQGRGGLNRGVLNQLEQLEKEGY